MAKSKLPVKKMQSGIPGLQSDIAKITGITAVGFFKDTFTKQGFTDKGFKKWKKRKQGSPRNRGRNILIDSGTMRRSIKIRAINKSKVIVGTGREAPYAEYHNEGTKDIPQRKFIGESEQLRRKTLKLVYKKIDRVLGF